MKEKDLWALAVEALDLYFSSLDLSPISTDLSVEETLSCSTSVHPSEEIFLKECTAGVVRFSPLCEAALRGYITHLKRNAGGSKYSLYLITYLLIFRYSEIGFKELRALFEGAAIAPKVAEFVAFLLDESALREAVLPLWLLSYDDEFLEECVFEPLREIAEEATVEIVDYFHRKGLSSQTARPITSTDDPGLPPSKPRKKSKPPVRKNLTATNNSTLPPFEVREMIHTIPEPRPRPVRVNGTGPVEAPRSAKPPTEPVGFSFHSRKPLTKPKKKSLSGSLQDPRVGVDRRSSKELRKILDKNVDIKHTNAALKREAFLNEKREKEEKERLANKEFCLRDEQNYEVWRKEQKEKEDEEKRIAVLERHLDALERAENNNQLKLAREEKRREQMRKEREAAAKQEKKHRRLEASRTQKQRGYVQKLRSDLQKGRMAAVESTTAEKLKAAEEVKKENERLAQIKKDKEEQEKNERAILIEEIRLLRSRIKGQKGNRLGSESPSSRRSVDDGLQTMDHGELQKELAAVREREKRLEEEKRREIATEKKKELEERTKLEEDLRLERERRRKQRERAREEKRAQEESIKATKQNMENQRMVELYEKLETKRNAKRIEMTRNEEQERKNKYELLLHSKDSTALEQQRWKQIEDGAVNRVVANQRKGVR